MVYFSLNTLVSQRESLSRLLKMRVGSNLDAYLGLPIPVGKKKYDAFKSILERTANRIHSWFKRLLSYGGKEIFIKAILQAVPTYAFSIFLAPNGDLDKILAMLSQVWWGGNENTCG